MSHEFVTTERHDDGTASAQLTERVDAFVQKYALGETELVFQEAKGRLDKAEHTLSAIEEFSENPANELEDMLAQAKAIGEPAAISDTDRVAELAIVGGKDEQGALAHELNTQLNSGEPGVVIDAIKDLGVVNPSQMSELVAALDTEVYFHGSNYPFEIGDQIQPGEGAILGKDGKLNASATTDERIAWAYAMDKENLPTGWREMESGKNLRARVYEVVPSDGRPAQRLGPQRGEVNSPAFTVVGFRDAQPGHQGTIPEVNWAKYGPYSGLNHPEDPLYRPESDYVELYQHSPDDIPLPGLGDKYVHTEQERIRKASGIPIM
ncbi:MAG TPA: hypothetical protein VGE13_04180 [Candidatus Saccharimonadales bacterium]